MHISFHNQKKIVELICGNGIAKIGGKKICCNWFVAMPLLKQEKFFFFLAIVAMPLPKMEGKKKQWLPKFGEELKKKKVLHPQYFYNKSQVINYYQFKFEFNIEITFLIQ